MVTIEVLNKSGVVRREVKMTDGETKMKATLASLKSVSFGEIFGNRPSEKVCQLVSSRFHIKLGRVPIRYDDTEAYYLLVHDGRLTKDLTKQISLFIDGAVAMWKSL